MSSNNDWAPLKEVIIGTAKTYSIPKLNRSFMKCQFPEYVEEDIAVGAYPDWVLEEQEEDLTIFADTLTSLSVIVHRPDLTHDHPDNWSYHSPRDCAMVVGNTIIEVPSPMYNRQFETWGYRKTFTELWQDGYQWIKAPMPILFDENYKEDTKGVASLNNHEILFEAANCIRVNDDIIYQVSNTGNEMGARWLQSVLGNKYKVHTYDNIYSFAHLDSTIIPLREGLVMYNASRVNEDNEPDLFKSWDKIWIDECVSPERKTNLPWGASAWIGMNLLSVNPNLVIVDKKQKQIIEKLKENNIDCIPLELRHDRLLAGGFHCASLDLLRHD